jgi:hypothetical protein
VCAHDAADGEWTMTRGQILPRLVAGGDGESVDGMRESELGAARSPR